MDVCTCALPSPPSPQVSHFHMVRWHEAALERHAAELAGLQATRHQLAERLGGDDGDASEGAGEEPAAAAAAASGRALARPGTASSSSGSLAPPHHHHHPQQQAQWQRQDSGGGLLDPDARDGSGDVTVTGRAAMQLRRGTASELEEVEARASDEAEWGQVLAAVHGGLLSGRQLIWEEVARRVGVLLSSPAAFEGEHFLQVGGWGGWLPACCWLPACLSVSFASLAG